jgi:glycopeptide antibiotics resistance protein
MQWFWQIFLNIILFVPFGFLFPIIFRELLNRLKVPEVSTVFIGCIFSLAIETMQYITGRGLADIDDLINNTFGTILGYLIYRVGKRRYEREKARIIDAYDIGSKYEI